MAYLSITYQRPDALKPNPRNARTHSKKQISQIAASIAQFGFVNPVLVDRENAIVAGHGRVKAAMTLGTVSQVPTICLEDMTAEERKAYIIADNRLAELAGWDREILAIEFQELDELSIDFDVEVVGFDAPEIDILIGEFNAPNTREEEVSLPDAASLPQVTRPGDVWLLGNHRLMCGDALELATLRQLMNGELAQMVFVDPPYNVPIEGHVCGLGGVHHRDFAMGVGEMSEDQFTDFLTSVFKNLASISIDGSIHFVCMDWRHMRELLTAGHKVYDEQKNLCVWNKSNGGMGSLYRSKHELVAVYKSGQKSHINNVELGKHGRYRTNVWDYAGINSFGHDRDEALAMHPTVKPVDMVADAILDCSSRHGIIVDCFGGSGTTLIAAEKVGRRANLLELDQAYVDVIIERWCREGGDSPIHEQIGRTYDEIKSVRCPDEPPIFTPEMANLVTQNGEISNVQG